MAIVVKKNQSWAVEKEVTEGTYRAPQSAAAFVQTLQDGSEMSRSKELLERNIFTSSIGKTSPRTGQFQVSGSIGVEAKAFSTEGSAPEFSALMESALGSRRQIASEITSGISHTAKRIFLSNTSTLAVGDIILVKEDGAFHVSPIESISTNVHIELVIEASAPFSDAVVIAKSTIFNVADSGHPSLSISRYLEGSVLQYAVGAKVSSLSLENFSTGQIPSFNFSFEGLNFDSSLTAPPYSPSYDSQLPPIILNARVYMDDSVIDVNEMSFTLENTLGYQSSVNEINGRKSSRATERSITGSFNPYMSSDSLANYNKFKNNTPFSVFAYAKLPSSTAGEFSGIVAVYMPNCMITELAEADQDGLLQDNISFSANRGVTGTTPEIYIAFI